MLSGRAHAISPAIDRSRSWRWYFSDGLQAIAEGSDTDDRTTYTFAPLAIRENRGQGTYFFPDVVPP